MRLWARHFPSPDSYQGSLRHDFVIGPLSDSPLFKRKARLYCCIRCDWRFLVCGTKVAILDGKGVALTGTQASARFNTFQDGPCPVLAAFASEMAAKAQSARPRRALRLLRRPPRSYCGKQPGRP